MILSTAVILTQLVRRKTHSRHQRICCPFALDDAQMSAGCRRRLTLRRGEFRGIGVLHLQRDNLAGNARSSLIVRLLHSEKKLADVVT